MFSNVNGKNDEQQSKPKNLIISKGENDLLLTKSYGTRIKARALDLFSTFSSQVKPFTETVPVAAGKSKAVSFANAVRTTDEVLTPVAISIIKYVNTVNTIRSIFGFVFLGVDAAYVVFGLTVDYKEFATRLVSVTGSWTLGIAGSYVGSTTGALAGTIIGSMFFGVGGIPGAAIGSLIGGVALGTTSGTVGRKYGLKHSQNLLNKNIENGKANQNEPEREQIMYIYVTETGEFSINIVKKPNYHPLFKIQDIRRFFITLSRSFKKTLKAIIINFDNWPIQEDFQNQDLYELMKNTFMGIDVLFIDSTILLTSAYLFATQSSVPPGEKCLVINIFDERCDIVEMRRNNFNNEYEIVGIRNVKAAPSYNTFEIKQTIFNNENPSLTIYSNQGKYQRNKDLENLVAFTVSTSNLVNSVRFCDRLEQHLVDVLFQISNFFAGDETLPKVRYHKYKFANSENDALQKKMTMLNKMRSDADL